MSLIDDAVRLRETVCAPYSSIKDGVPVRAAAGVVSCPRANRSALIESGLR